ncbi:MAG: hypothetical protein JNM52_07415 [Betaproteobacteria bacterium]|nr:hypothetical protein [Betaproteobacteria bacterium]
MKSTTKVTGTLLALAAAGLLMSASVQAADSKEAGVVCVGGNACKGKSVCKAGKNAECKGHNACKGQGASMAKDKAECEKAGGKVADAAPAKK